MSFGKYYIHDISSAQAVLNNAASSKLMVGKNTLERMVHGYLDLLAASATI